MPPVLHACCAGLDRADGTMDSAYNYVSSGTGVCIFVVDTGVAKAGHWDFGTRRLAGTYVQYSTDVSGQTDDDHNGVSHSTVQQSSHIDHGVAVALSIAPAWQHGVARYHSTLHSSPTLSPLPPKHHNHPGTPLRLVQGSGWDTEMGTADNLDQFPRRLLTADPKARLVV